MGTEFNFSDLVQAPAGSRTTNYDLRYSESKKTGKGKWRLSDNAFTLMGLANKGLNVFNHDGVVLVSTQSEGSSKHFKGKPGKNKTQGFTNPNLRTWLDAAGYNANDRFGLHRVEVNGAPSGSTFYVVKPWVEREGSPLSAEMLASGNSTPAEAAPVDEEEVEEEDDLDFTDDDDDDEVEDAVVVEEVNENPFG